MNRNLKTSVAAIIVNGQTAAQINAAGAVEVLKDSGRLQEILNEYREASQTGGMDGLSPELFACWLTSKRYKEFKLLVDVFDWTEGDVLPN